MSQNAASANAEPSGLVYCRCAYARVVPRKVKDGVLEALATSGVDFDAVPDLCEMSARKDPRLAEIAGAGTVTIAACYPRAVRWLFASAGSPLDSERVTVLNMREETAEAVGAAMLSPEARAALAEDGGGRGGPGAGAGSAGGGGAGAVPGADADAGPAGADAGRAEDNAGAPGGNGGPTVDTGVGDIGGGGR